MANKILLMLMLLLMLLYTKGLYVIFIIVECYFHRYFICTVCVHIIYIYVYIRDGRYTGIDDIYRY